MHVATLLSLAATVAGSPMSNYMTSIEGRGKFSGNVWLFIIQQHINTSHRRESQQLTDEQLPILRPTRRRCLLQRRRSVPR